MQRAHSKHSCPSTAPPSTTPELTRFPSWMANSADPFRTDYFSPSLPSAMNVVNRNAARLAARPVSISTISLKPLQQADSNDGASGTTTERTAKHEILQESMPSDDRVAHKTNDYSDADMHNPSLLCAFDTLLISEAAAAPMFPPGDDLNLNVLASFPEPPTHIPTRRRSYRPRPITLDGTEFSFPFRTFERLHKDKSFVGLRSLKIPTTPFNPFGEASESALGARASETGSTDEDVSNERGSVEDEEIIVSALSEEPISPVTVDSETFRSRNNIPERARLKRPLSVRLTSLHMPSFHYSLMDLQHRFSSSRGPSRSERSVPSRAPTSGSEYSQTSSLLEVSDAPSESPAKITEITLTLHSKTRSTQEAISPAMPIQAPPAQAEVAAEDEESPRPSRRNSVNKKVIGTLRKIAHTVKKVASS
ncbi:hypothetical protein EW145_g673 [Phellinidium pouzarii]|uniref:Uncharacterized protein n=1 Tax=Phellinidium pouzarii TaxID=167371 RepID=A0A4S4LHQ7_9AGAM|nr:hypothetical protein EW145_g673 [Phellinidium pouzarii]